MCALVTSEQQRTEAPTERDDGLGALTGVCFGLLLIGLVSCAALLLDLVSPWLAWGCVGVSLAIGLPGGIAGTHRRRRHG
jgi:hypothetical protein